MTNFAADMAVKAAHGLTLTQWNRLTEQERRHLRDTVTTAPHFQENQ
jgi:hypothetical protein